MAIYEETLNLHDIAFNVSQAAYSMALDVNISITNP